MQYAWSNPYAPNAWNSPYTPPLGQNYGYAAAHPYRQANGRTLVDGPAEAMNRFLMQYPANQLVPGFISDELFDVNGRQFHVLSVEADGRRNLETFDYLPHKDDSKIMVDGVEFESREEFDTLAAKVRAVLGVHGGVSTAVQSGRAETGDAATDGSGAQPVRPVGAGQDRDPQGPDRGRPSGGTGPAV